MSFENYLKGNVNLKKDYSMNKSDGKTIVNESINYSSIENKLDILINEIRGLRKDLTSNISSSNTIIGKVKAESYNKQVPNNKNVPIQPSISDMDLERIGMI